ncbi:NAD(P)/FAD-dependent oxidoreductase [Sulfurimonas aquatica]|uniref:NAD(P)/FAD-dependent oxidoreductase n=2 Tax=Sulfurimonas aquatica TaxID=2672570 RepID=A0A975B2K6_9BACT|nr:NAD(P)/FAD-dependent oxidoreductase [Sulfurimonas aquatica]
MNRVVVIGGGYGGLRAVEGLSTYEDIEITLIDQNPYHYLQTQAYGYIAGEFDVNEVAVDLYNWSLGFKRVKFIQATVSSVDFVKQEVFMGEEQLSYDYVILAYGAKTNFFSFIEGLRENSYGVKSLYRAFNFRKEFENVIYKKLQNTDDSSSQELNIVIGGAGLSGVEVAAEMAHVIKNYSKTIGSRAKEIKIYLVDASETILPGTSDYIIKNTFKRLESLGVNILTNAFISKVDKSFVYFKDAEPLEYSFMIFTGGIKASPLNEVIESEKNKMDQLLVDKNLNISGFDNAFAIGDCIEMKGADGNILAPTAQSAERSAEYAAKAIKNRIDGTQYKGFNSSTMGIFVALGGKYAVGEVFKYIKVRGYIAYTLKTAITYGYYIGLRLRINTGFKNRI